MSVLCVRRRGRSVRPDFGVVKPTRATGGGRRASRGRPRARTQREWFERHPASYPIVVAARGDQVWRAAPSCLLPERLLDAPERGGDRKSTRLNSSHTVISYAVFCLKKKMAAMYTARVGLHRMR